MRILTLLAGLGLGAIAFLPARLVLPAPPLAASTVSGSLWRAALVEAQLGGVGLGTLALTAQPLALVQGRLQWQLAGPLEGQVWRSVNALGAEGLNGRLASMAVPGLPIRSLDLAGVGVSLDAAGRCQAASGQITASLASRIAGQDRLAGSPACAGEALMLPLASADARLRLDLAIRPGRWQAVARVNGAAPAELVALAAAGFRPDGSGVSLVREGAW